MRWWRTGKPILTVPIPLETCNFLLWVNSYINMIIILIISSAYWSTAQSHQILQYPSRWLSSPSPTGCKKINFVHVMVLEQPPNFYPPAIYPNYSAVYSSQFADVCFAKMLLGQQSAKVLCCKVVLDEIHGTMGLVHCCGTTDDLYLVMIFE